MHEAQETAAQEAHAGRPGAGQQGTSLTGRPGGRPEGRPTRIDPNQKAEGRRSIGRENSGAEILAGLGYRVKQNPTPDEVARARQDTGDTGDPASRPDYLVEGRVFDCYSPATDTGVRSVWTEVRKKIRRDQTQRVVVNLEDWGGDLTALRKQFGDWPIDRLKEVKAITPDGDVVQIVPEPRQ